MTLVRWNPNRDLDVLHHEMNRLFDDVFTSSLCPAVLSEFVPAAEIEESDEAYHLRLEVPGIQKDDLDIQVTAKTLAVKGERKSSTNTKKEGAIRSEFRYGSFSRVVSLPGKVYHQKVTADYSNGILSLTLPKAEEEKNKIVKVNVG